MPQLNRMSKEKAEEGHLHAAQTFAIKNVLALTVIRNVKITEPF